MKDKFLQFIAEHSLLTKEDTVLVAVSGGIDSCVLLDLLFAHGFNCIVAHCNFKLRGEDSDNDEQFVKDLAIKYGFRFFSTSFDTANYAENNGVSIQMAARDLRYKFFNELAQLNACTAIATAHHGDDNIETMYINLLHGTGLKGLGGIPIRSGKIIRPLLYAFRTEIENYARENKLKWRTDKSNLSNKYTRNKIRNEIIPILEEIKPGFRAIMHRNIEYFRDSETLISELLHERIEQIAQFKEDSVYISIPELLKWKSGKTILFHIINPYGFDSKQIEKIWNSIPNLSGKMFYSRTHLLNKDRDNIIVAEIKNNDQKQKFYIDEDVDFINEPVELSIETYPWNSDETIPKEKKTILVDADSITYPLIIRHWQAGDYFQPFGMNGMKKLSDFFIDEKIPNTEKNNVWIIESSNKIVWVVGFRSDERFKITHNTQRVIKLQLF